MVKSWAAVTDEELMQMSSQNPELQFERNADATLVTMPPTGGISGNRFSVSSRWDNYSVSSYGDFEW